MNNGERCLWPVEKMGDKYRGVSIVEVGCVEWLEGVRSGLDFCQ